MRFKAYATELLVFKSSFKAYGTALLGFDVRILVHGTGKMARPKRFKAYGMELWHLSSNLRFTVRMFGRFKAFFFFKACGAELCFYDVRFKDCVSELTQAPKCVSFRLAG